MVTVTGRNPYFVAADGRNAYTLHVGYPMLASAGATYGGASNGQWIYVFLFSTDGLAQVYADQTSGILYTQPGERCQSEQFPCEQYPYRNRAGGFD